jgi:hypothetical protein
MLKSGPIPDSISAGSRMTFTASATLGLAVLLAAPPEAKPKPKFTLGKDTTYITEPLDKDGYVDYETALNERLRGTITPETNAVVLLMQAIGPKPEGKELHADWWTWLGVKPPPEAGEYFVSLDEYRKKKRGEKQPSEDEQERETQDDVFVRSRPWTSESFPIHAAWLKTSSRFIDIAHMASKRKDYFNPVISRESNGSRGMLLGAITVGLQEIRRFADALAMRAMQRAGEGRFDEAWDDLMAIHRLARLCDRGGNMIEMLVGCATGAIATEATYAYLDVAKPGRERLARLQADLDRLPAISGVSDRVVFSERLNWLDTAQAISRHGLSLMERINDGKPTHGEHPADAVERIYGPFDWNTSLRMGNHWFNKYAIGLNRTDRAKYRIAVDKLDAENKLQRVETLEALNIYRMENFGKTFKVVMGEVIGQILIALYSPAMLKASLAADRAEQGFINLRLAFALAEYKLANGTYPQKLADLAPKSIPAIPDDLFNGKPLVYKPAKDGYLLYSVGANRKDDGGNGRDDDPAGDDLAIRMPLPKLKRE